MKTVDGNLMYNILDMLKCETFLPKNFSCVQQLMVAEKDHPQLLEKAAVAIEMSQRQLQSRSSNGHAVAAIAKPKWQSKCHCSN